MQKWIEHMKKLRLDDNYRNQSKSVFLTGSKCISEYKDVPIAMACTRKYYDRFHPKVDYIITERQLKDISGQETPQGIILEVPLKIQPLNSSLKKFIVLENVQNPGNMGTIIRTAYSLGWDAAYLIGGANPTQISVLRSSMGTALNFPIGIGNIDQFLHLCLDFNLEIGISCANTISTYPKSDKIGLILGSEGQGISQILKDRSHFTASIYTKLDSLNVAVAAGILMYSLCKKIN